MTHEPTYITPPTGTYRVLVWSGAKVEELAERPETEEGRAQALALFNAARFAAAFCHGVVVVKRNGRGDAHSAAFRAYLGAAPSAPAPRPVVAAKPARPVEMPVREPTRPVEEPADPRELARAANHPGSSESSPAPVAAVEAPAVTPRPVEPPAAPVALPKPVEEPMPAKTPKPAKAEKKLCTNCNSEPTAVVTKRTRKGHEAWCGKCRKAHWTPAPKAWQPADAPPKAPKTAPVPRAAAPSLGTLDTSLALVEAHATLIRRLGGVDAATRLAVLVETHGDAVAHVVERVLAIGGAS